ncbi:hypothetical protein HPB47_001721 [Ixodes persulcatus]|uniref:Uncharacterized protein n=1 Tax=Ixodes persulcatus TaxID=34615 RepID=A0AC60PPS6_IXOPE|nr:hypothetical protein HPB47_001721 [Ixodes persulcatus]
MVQRSRVRCGAWRKTARAFGSISLMLDSTYQALQNSFRAMVGVADQFGRLKGHLAQTLSALALIRSLRWLFYAALRLLGTTARVCSAARCPAPQRLRDRPLPCHPGLFKATQPPEPGPLWRLAEDSTRGAFQSVESVVQAFGSISLMLDSTYQALQNSFRAMVGVADQFGRLKGHLAQTLSALALIRSLRWLFYAALRLLGLRSQGSGAEAAWARALTADPGDPAEPGGGSPTWPILAFLAFVLGAPWLLWRIFSAANKRAGGCGKGLASQWASGAGDHFVAVAQFSFRPENSTELAVKAGQQLRLAPKDQQPRVRGWLLASTDGIQIGLVPANYVKVLGPSKGHLQQPSQEPPKEGPKDTSKDT